MKRINNKQKRILKIIPYDFILNSKSYMLLLDSPLMENNKKNFLNQEFYDLITNEKKEFNKKKYKKNIQIVYEKIFNNQIPIKQSLLLNNSEKVKKKKKIIINL